MTINQISSEVEQISKDYTTKFNITRTDDWFMLKLQEELGELTQSFLMMTHQARIKDNSEDQLRTNFEQELADSLCHILLLAKHYDIDLETQIQSKWVGWKASSSST